MFARREQQAGSAEAGFTLLKVLVALAIAALVLLYRQGAVTLGTARTAATCQEAISRAQSRLDGLTGRAWLRAKRGRRRWRLPVLDPYHAGRISELAAVDRVSRHMVALADPGMFSEPATLHGTAQRLSFTTELPLGGDRQAQRADVALSAEARRLLLRWRLHRHAEFYGAEPDVQETVTLDGVERLELAYWASGTWVSIWNADKRGAGSDLPPRTAPSKRRCSTCCGAAGRSGTSPRRQAACPAQI